MPAKATESTKDSLLPSLSPPSHPTADAVFPSYFAVNIQISRESLLPDLRGGNAAELHFASHLLPPPLVRQVA
jgi:hypothetical protein